MGYVTLQTEKVINGGNFNQSMFIFPLPEPCTAHEAGSPLSPSNRPCKAGSVAARCIARGALSHL